MQFLNSNTNMVLVPTKQYYSISIDIPITIKDVLLTLTTVKKDTSWISKIYILKGAIKYISVISK